MYLSTVGQARNLNLTHRVTPESEVLLGDVADGVHKYPVSGIHRH